MPEKITVQVDVNAPIETVWETLNQPEHIVHWNFASDDWHCPKASTDFRVGGNLAATMAANDGSMSFDLEGVYDEIIEYEKIVYSMPDGRRVELIFSVENGHVHIEETFDAEESNPVEMQKMGWQAILNNFKTYAESIT